MKLYGAGAGSGKTYTITKEIVHRLADGTARPERILATTFTRKAAAELKDRIQSRLLKPEEGDPAMPLPQRLDLASRINDSIIGTVHSVGHQLLGRYALHLGLSPQLEPLEEASQERHLRRILADMDPQGLEELDRLATRFGIAKYQELVLEVLDAKRANAIPDDRFRESMGDGVERFIQIISGGESKALESFSQLYDLARDAIERVRANEDATKTTASAIETLDKFCRGRREVWEAWGKFAKLKVAKKSEGDVADLVTLARRANVHTALHADLRAFNAALVARVLELQDLYASYKASRGLVDFTDLEERFLDLVNTPAIMEELDFDLVVVDEFQDTNPIQLAIFQRLTARQTIWVGDEKQAIYGFRGTDPELMQGVVSTVPENDRETLPRNWRSKAELVDIVNRIFTPIFGPDTPLQPVRGTGGGAQRWALAGRNKSQRREAFVAQMQQLVDSTAPGDIAVLVRKNDDAKELAALMDAHGIPCLVQTSGLLSTRECELILAGLRFVADKKDLLAAATIAHLEGDAWFPAAVQDRDALLAGPRLDALRELDARKMPPSSVVAAVSQALSVADRVAAWGEPGRRLANVDELVRLATQYEVEAEQEGKAATLTGLVFWLENLRSDGEDKLPLPSVDAVKIMTLWKSKGLEWPCVVMFQDGAPRDPDPFKVHVDGGDPAGDPLRGRTIRYWPYPFGRTFMGGFGTDGSGVQDAVKNSPEGEALLAAQKAETRRLLYVGFTRARDQLILAEGDKHSLGLLPELDAVLPLEEVGRECAGEPAPRAAPGAVAWFTPTSGPVSHPARYHSPSKAEAVPCETEAKKICDDMLPKLQTLDWQALGQAVHAYLAAVPAMAALNDFKRARHARLCLRRWGCEGHLEPEQLVRAGKTLQSWREGAWHVEVPVSAPRAGGGTWSGIVDLIVGDAIIDHKSADWRSGWGSKAKQYSGQLAVYQEVLGGRTFIHMPLGGAMVEVKA